MTKTPVQVADHRMISRALLSLLVALLLSSLASASLVAATEPSEEHSYSSLVVDMEALPSVFSGDDSDDPSFLPPLKSVSLACRPASSSLPEPVDLRFTAERPQPH